MYPRGGGQSSGSPLSGSQVAIVWFGANQEDTQGVTVTTPFIPESTSISPPPSVLRECNYSFRLPFRLQYAASRIGTPTDEVRSLALGHHTLPLASTDWSSTPPQHSSIDFVRFRVPITPCPGCEKRDENHQMA